jgi:hypothetical protein
MFKIMGDVILGKITVTCENNEATFNVTIEKNSPNVNINVDSINKYKYLEQNQDIVIGLAILKKALLDVCAFEKKKLHAFLLEYPRINLTAHRERTHSHPETLDPAIITQ